MQKTNTLIRLRGCANCFECLLGHISEGMFSHIEVHIHVASGWVVSIADLKLTHFCIACLKMDTSKQCRPRLDAADNGVGSESSRFEFNI